MPEVLAVTNTIRELLDSRYDKRRQLLNGVVTSAPMVGGRSAGYVLATVGGVAGVRVNASTDLRVPLTVGDEITVEGVGTPSSTSYQVINRTSGTRADSDVFVFPAATTAGGASYAPGDILLGSTLADWANWWYEFAEGRWRIRQGETLQGAIGNLSGLYDYANTVYGSVFGEYEPDKVWIATDPQNGFRVMAYDVRTFQVGTDGTMRSGRAGEAEIVIAPGEQQISFVVGGAVQSAIDAESRTIYGFERLGLPLGPAIEWGPIPDASGEEALERWGFWLRNHEGDRFMAILSGTADAPDDASFRVGAQGATHYLEYKDGELTIAGNITILNAGEASSVAWDDITGRPSGLTEDDAPAADGLYLTANYLGFWDADTTAWQSYIDSSGNFYLGGATGPFTWTAGTSTLNFSGWTGTAAAFYKLASGTPASSPSDGITLETTGGTNTKPVIRVYDGATLNAALGNYADGKYGVYATEGLIGGWTIYSDGLYSSALGQIFLSAANKSISVGNSTYGYDGIQLQYNGGNPRAYIGNGTDRYLHFDGTNLSWAAENCTLSTAGIMTVGGTPNITLTGATATIASSTYASDTAGWSIDGSGNAEFNNVSVRGAIRSAVFEYNQVQVTSGTSLITKSADVLATNMTAADNSTLTTAGTVTLAVNDYVRMKEGISDEWLKVTNIGSAPTYTVERDKAATYAANNNPAWKIGAAVANYGPADQGWLRLTADATNSPYLSVATHGGTPWTTYNGTTDTTGTRERARLGNLTGISGASGYGLWTDNGYFTGTVNWGGGKGVLNATGLDYTYATNDWVKIDAATATDGILRISALGTTFSNGISVDIDSAAYGCQVNHTDVYLGGGYQSNVEVGGTGGVNSTGYGYTTSLSRKAGASDAGNLFGYNCLLTSAVNDEVGYGVYSQLALSGTGTAAYTFYGLGGNIHNSGHINTADVYKVDDVQVVSNRVIDARCDDTINSGDATTDGVIDALRDAMIAHGLIAAA